jgi:hypothetical protein
MYLDYLGKRLKEAQGVVLEIGSGQRTCYYAGRRMYGLALLGGQRLDVLHWM